MRQICKSLSSLSSNLPSQKLLKVFGFLFLLTIVAATSFAQAPITIIDGASREVVATGASKGNQSLTFDEETKKDILEFDYVAMPKTSVAVKIQKFSQKLVSTSVSAIKIEAKVFQDSQLQEISVNAELNGDSGTQVIPLKLKSSWTVFQEKIDWAKIGILNNVSFKVKSLKNLTVKGTLAISFELNDSIIAKTTKKLSEVKSEAAKTVETISEKTATIAKDTKKTTKFATKKPFAERKKTAETAPSIVKEKAKEIVPVAAKPKMQPSARTFFGLLDASAKSVSGVGASKGSINFSFDDEARKDVYDFAYTFVEGNPITISTKNFPEDLKSTHVNTIEIGFRALEARQLREVSTKVELVGASATQDFALGIKPGWNTIRKTIDWQKLGDLKEVNFVITPKSKEISKGTLYLGMDFFNESFTQRFFVGIKFGAVILLSLILAVILPFMSNFIKRVFVKESDKNLNIISPKGESIFSRLKKDFLYGLMTVLVIGTGLWIYSLGRTSISGTCLITKILLIGLLGGIIAAWMKCVLAGKAITAAETFQNVFVAGLLAASASSLELLQIPTSWIHLLMINKLTAIVAFFIYQIFNVHNFSSFGRSTKPIAAALIVGTPYLVGILLLLENVTLLQTLTYNFSFGVLATFPNALEFLGRLAVVFLFNELLANGISYATKERVVPTLKAHLYIFLVSLAVVIAPSIADFGSSAMVAKLPEIVRALVALATTILSFGGLWGEVYLITGILLDGGKRIAPTADSIVKNVSGGIKKGMAYSGILIAILYLISMLFKAPVSQNVMASFPYVIGTLGGMLLFPFVKTIIETFDGSLPFFERAAYSYRSKTLYFRGAIAGAGLAYLISQGYIEKSMSERVWLGAIIGFIASGGISLLRDIYYSIRHQGKVQTWRLYFIDSILGVFLGGAVAFYLDVPQVSVIIYKLNLYVTTYFTTAQCNAYPAFNHLGEMSTTVYPYLNDLGHYVQPVLLSKWGMIDLGKCTGGVKLLFTESLDGVIKWSVATWLFAVNKVFLQAFFDKDKAPIKFFFSKAGLAQLSELMIHVLRWGLWMSPIIYTFLRMMPNPTWYNQDGAIRTLFAIYNNITMSAPDFVAWSLKMFVWILAFDFFRILIWMDHMGLRVATLVNLSFLGMEKLDEKVSKFIGKASAQRYIPEGVKRFTTWAPLLIPFYIPRGEQWDEVWSKAENIQNSLRGKGLIPALQALPFAQLLLWIIAGVLVCTIISFITRILRSKSAARQIQANEIANCEYKVVAKQNGEIYSELIGKECDISRRSYDQIDPSGRILFIVDETGGTEGRPLAWPITGNFPSEEFVPSNVERKDESIVITNVSHGVKAVVTITIPTSTATAEIWNISIENQSEKTRHLKVVPYLEWVLNGGMHDRFHTQYARLYPEMEYVAKSNAIVTWQKSTKSTGFMATDVAPEGLHTGRVDFIGRGRSVWQPRALEIFDFLPAQDMKGYPTFDPIGSLLVSETVSPHSSASFKMIIGYSKNKQGALDTIEKYLKPNPAPRSVISEKPARKLLIGHGEIPSGTPQPYYQYSEDGNTLKVLTPYTPRPFDHAMSNPMHSVMVTNRGLHTSCNGNSQQNRLTPDWPDTATKEVPSEAIYLYDSDRDEWYSPTYQPLNDNNAHHEAEFSVDGTAVFTMKDGSLSSRLTVYVPTEDPLGVYLLTLKNDENTPRKLRVAPYFQIALSFQPERSGPLQVKHDKASDALYFENPRNFFRPGWAFASMSVPADCVETKRGRFFGTGRGIKRPYIVENDTPDTTQITDSAQIAGFVGTVEIPAQGEVTVAIVLGQTENHKHAVELVQKYKNLDLVRKELDATRSWWLNLMGTLKVETNQPEFDHYQNWLKYQALAERIWARRGFYQTSGAFGFRDQLQDTVNLIWINPALARKQILLHAAQQFVEGDVNHWFFTLPDGRTSFSCRSHASDNPLWLAWGAVEYVRATGDESILDEMESYMVSEFPFAQLPKNKQGWGHMYHRTTRSDTLYKHCMRSIDLVIKQRSGRNGLPLMGVGDWNDGLDEIGGEGIGESVWLGFFLYYILKEMVGIIGKKEGDAKKKFYQDKIEALKVALEKTWRDDRYLRAFHDDGTEIGLKGSGVWEIDALTAAWSVMSGINFERGVTIFNTALQVLEKDNAILLGWPALREDTKPYLGRSSKYPEGVRENGMYCHGVQWLVRAARLLAEEFEKRGDSASAEQYRATAYRLWLKISPISHMNEIEIYGGQPNKQSADLLTTYEPGRMIWHGYTGAAGWMLRQAMEGVVGATLKNNKVIWPDDLSKSRGEMKISKVTRTVQ